MNSNLGSVFGHALGGLVVTGLTLLVTQLPLEWQSLTIGTVLAGALKWAHLYWA